MPNPVMHFEVMTPDNPEKLQKFYADAFDWQVNADNPMKYGMVDNGGKGINGGIGKPEMGGAYATFYIQVDDLQKALDRIEKLGGKTIMRPTDIQMGGVSIAMFKDPAGNLIGITKIK